MQNGQGKTWLIAGLAVAFLVLLFIVIHINFLAPRKEYRSALGEEFTFNLSLAGGYTVPSSGNFHISDKWIKIINREIYNDKANPIILKHILNLPLDFRVKGSRLELLRYMLQQRTVYFDYSPTNFGFQNTTEADDALFNMTINPKFQSLLEKHPEMIGLIKTPSTASSVKKGTP